MLYLTIEIRTDVGLSDAKLENFIKVSPDHFNEDRDRLLKDIQRAAHSRLGPETKLLHVLGTHSSPDLTLAFVFAGGVAAYGVIRDYPDLREGVRLLIEDIKWLINKLPFVGNPETTKVSEKYPPEVGDNIAKVKR